MMDFGGINLATLLATLMVTSVPVMLAALGETVVERSGVLNLGVEGMMIIGAAGGFIISVQSGSPFLGFVGGAACGALLALVFAFLTLGLQANQVATGLALTLFGLGVSSLVGQGYNGIKPPATGAVPFGPLADIGFFGQVFFRHNWVVYFSIAMTAAIWWLLRATRLGLVIRAVGESHEAAHALGYKVNRVRLGCILFGGAMAGMGGAYVSLIRVPQWTDNITAGTGWIALAIVVFASWQPWRVLLGAWMFGGIAALQLNIQVANGLPTSLLGVITLVLLVWIGLLTLSRMARGLPPRPPLAFIAIALAVCILYAFAQGTGLARISIPVEYLSMAPYVVTILVLVIMSSGGTRAGLGAPAALGKNFHASS